jgi:hypothetical protein
MRSRKPVPAQVNPAEALREGAAILDEVLVPLGFQFIFGGDGKSSGGPYSQGNFVRGNRRLEVHFRLSLGLVRYHIGAVNASHDAYMSELGVRGKCNYPGYSDDFRDAFRDLAHDLAFAEDFLSGEGTALSRAAATERKPRKTIP